MGVFSLFVFHSPVVAVFSMFDVCVEEDWALSVAIPSELFVPLGDVGHVAEVPMNACCNRSVVMGDHMSAS